MHVILMIVLNDYHYIETVGLFTQVCNSGPHDPVVFYVRDVSFALSWPIAIVFVLRRFLYTFMNLYH